MKKSTLMLKTNKGNLVIRMRVDEIIPTSSGDRFVYFMANTDTCYVYRIINEFKYNYLRNMAINDNIGYDLEIDKDTTRSLSMEFLNAVARCKATGFDSDEQEAYLRMVLTNELFEGLLELDVADRIENARVGEEFYSLAHGPVFFREYDRGSGIISMTDANKTELFFANNGSLYSTIDTKYPCVLFPSSEIKTWSGIFYA